EELRDRPGPARAGAGLDEAHVARGRRGDAELDAAAPDAAQGVAGGPVERALVGGDVEEAAPDGAVEGHLQGEPDRCFLVDAREPAHQGNGGDGAEIELEPLAAAHGAGGAPHGGGVTVEGPGGAGGALAGGGAEGVGVQLAEGL